MYWNSDITQLWKKVLALTQKIEPFPVLARSMNPAISPDFFRNPVFSPTIMPVHAFTLSPGGTLKFSSDSTATGDSIIPGLFECSRGNCKLCKLYKQVCTSFLTANSVEWHIKNNITCQSKKVIYFLKCICCNLSTSYLGKTKCFRDRMNNHISECRSGNTSDIFDRHVFKCKEINDINQEPHSQIFAFMTVSTENLLIPYQSYLHSKKFDTLNC